jgi:predicted amidohydrolase
MEVFEKAVDEAAAKGVQLFSTCECYLDGYYMAEADEKGFDRDRLMANAQELHNSSYLDRVRTTAKARAMHIVFGFTMKEGERIKNSALFVDDEGNDIGVYSKTHLLNHDTNFTRGDDLTVFDTKLGKIGLMICADRRWPETPRTLRVKGAELIVNPTYGMWHEFNEWMMRTRAYENELYIAFAHPRVSFLCGPKGELEAKLLTSVSGILYCDVDLDVKIEKMVPNRQPDLYTVLTQHAGKEM